VTAPAGRDPDRPRRFVALAGKITPTRRDGSGSADAGGTVDSAHGSAKEARNLDERDQASHSAGEHELASEVSERIRAIISSAEAAANAVRHESEQAAQSRRRAAEDQAQRIVRDAKTDAEALVTERIRRINELSDGIVERGEKIVAQLDRAEDVRRQLQSLADSLGETAASLARDLGGEARSVPPAPPQPAVVEADEGDTAVEEDVAAEPGSTVARVVEREPAAPAAEEGSTDEGASEVVDLVEQRRESLRREEETVEEPAADDRREPDEQLSARLVALQMAVAGGNRGEVAEHLRRTFDVGDLEGILDDVFGSGTDADKRVVWPRTADA
jgi:hypothetical protein